MNDDEIDEAPERHPRASVEFNLEKPPLQTGLKEPRRGWWMKSGDGDHRWAAAWLVVLIALTILIVGGLVLYQVESLPW